MNTRFWSHSKHNKLTNTLDGIIDWHSEIWPLHTLHNYLWNLSTPVTQDLQTVTLSYWKSVQKAGQNWCSVFQPSRYSNTMIKNSARSISHCHNEPVAGQCLWCTTGVPLSSSVRRMEPGSWVSVWQSHVSRLLPFSMVPTSAQMAFSSTVTAGSTATGLTTRWDSTAAASRSVVFSLSSPCLIFSSNNISVHHLPLLSIVLSIHHAHPITHF